MSQLCQALNTLFYKIPKVVEGDEIDCAKWWVAELADKRIFVIWKGGLFIESSQKEVGEFLVGVK